MTVGRHDDCRFGRIANPEIASIEVVLWLARGLIDGRDVMPFVLVVQKTGGESILREADNIIGIQVQRLLYARKILANVAAEIGGIVGIDGRANPGIEQLL